MQDPSSAAAGTVFQFSIAPAPRVEEEELERHIIERIASFSILTRPLMGALELTHRVLRIEGERSKGDRYLWEITLEGLDLPSEEQSDRSLAAEVVDEVRAQLDTIGVIVASKKLVDVTPLGRGPRPLTRMPGGGQTAPSFSDDDAASVVLWGDFSPSAACASAGAAIPDATLADIKAARDQIPAEPNLKPTQGGHVYGGGGDKAHSAYVKEYLTTRAASLPFADRRRVLAFLALQGREGSTTAINTYDSQIVTWGTGWGGRGGLGRVMTLALRSEALYQLFYDCGLRYLGRNTYDVVDLAAKKVVSGNAPALQVIRGSVPLLNMLIFAARSPDTREAVLSAQLQAFVETSGNISGADLIATQALFNFIAHLKHWAPGYVIGALEAIAPMVADGPPSIERDKQIAPLVGRYFYGKARKTKWVPSFGQFKLYWAHMRDDGLDCMDDPLIKSPQPPTDGAFSGPVSVRGGA